MSDNDEVLVAREVPDCGNDADDLAAALTDKIKDMNIEDKPRKISGPKNNIQPADFLTLQSIRSSALARKTNTSNKFGKGSAALMADLLNMSISDEPKKPEEEKKEEEVKEKEEKEVEKPQEEKKEEEKDETKKDQDKEEGEEEEDEDSSLLISRGPVRAARQSVAPHHPYASANNRFATTYAATPASDTVGDYASYSAFGMGYECGTSVWQTNPVQDSPDLAGYVSNSSTPDTIQSTSETGYNNVASVSPATFHSPSYSPQDAQAANYQAHSNNVQRILDEDETDMPDNVSEFILAYSSMLETESKENMIYCRPPSTDSSCIDSPMSAGSAPHFSPGQPQSGNTGRISPLSVIPISTDRPARQRLRVHIGQENTEQAMLWMCKCVQGCNVSSRTSSLVEKKDGDTILFWQDKDKDTFLHICLLNLDVAKAYAIIEQQLKQERKPSEFPPWDLRNRFNESPLFIAVQNRQTLFVDYLLELNADPNVQSSRNQRETALMHAASRGMTDIVRTLLRDPRCKKDTENEERMSALQLAVWNNGLFDEVTQTNVDNLECVRLLIDAGADPAKTNSRGRNIYHMATQKCDHTMLEHLSRVISNDELSTAISNKPDEDGLKPINVLEKYNNKIEPQLYQSCFFALLTCNANVERASPTPGDKQ